MFDTKFDGCYIYFQLAILGVINTRKTVQKMHPVVLETMNDILNQVESREWRRVTQQRDTLLRHKKSLSKKIQSMEDDWYVATEKIGQENSDLHNEIKKLKDEIKGYKTDALNQGQININREKEIEKLKEEIKQLRNPEAGKNRLQMAFDDIKRLQQQVEVLKRRNKRLTKERDDFEFQFHKTLEHQANDAEEYEKQIEKLKETHEPQYPDVEYQFIYEIGAYR